MIESEHLFTITLHTEMPQVLGDTPAGARKVVQVPGGRFEGERLQGKILPGGGDWLLTRPDGALRLDVRLTLETDDGHIIGMTYTGLRHGPAEVLARHDRGEPVAASEYYFRIAPFFETGSDTYGWLNRIIAVGVGWRTDEGPGYDIHQIL
jgi:hypothetical protein